jgi:mono/diheme cytochrome c family protein
MRYLISALLASSLIAIGVYTWVSRYSEIDATKPIPASTFDNATIDKGAALVAIGDCAFCHTKPGGESFAGGRKLDTPFGAVFSSNITPEADTGIGAWSLAAFTRALREGVDRSGNYLYPAFPYDHFTKVKDDDIAAIYAYLMTRPPVTASRPENALPFPFNMRALVAGWNLLFLRAGAYTPDPSHDDHWNRGAYLVQGLGHCGACHTPRNIFGAERRSSARYAGETLEGWHAPALNTASPAPVPWTANAIVNFLLDGWDGDHGVAAGTMTAVVDSLGTLSEDDARAIATYVLSFQEQNQAAERTRAAKSFAQKVAYGQSSAVSTSPDTAEGRGEATFIRICANCHRAGTRSAPLALSSTISGPDPRNLIRIIDKGIQPPQNALDRSMPAFGGGLSDRDLTDLVTFVRSHFSKKPAWSDLADIIAEMRLSRP